MKFLRNSAPEDSVISTIRFKLQIAVLSLLSPKSIILDEKKNNVSLFEYHEILTRSFSKAVGIFNVLDTKVHARQTHLPTIHPDPNRGLGITL